MLHHLFVCSQYSFDKLCKITTFLLCWFGWFGIGAFCFYLKMILKCTEERFWDFLWKENKIYEFIDKMKSNKTIFFWPQSQDWSTGEGKNFVWNFFLFCQIEKKHVKTPANARFSYIHFCCPYYSLLLVGKSRTGL